MRKLLQQIDEVGTSLSQTFTRHWGVGEEYMGDHIEDNYDPEEEQRQLVLDLIVAVDAARVDGGGILHPEHVQRRLEAAGIYLERVEVLTEEEIAEEAAELDRLRKDAEERHKKRQAAED